MLLIKYMIYFMLPFKKKVSYLSVVVQACSFGTCEPGQEDHQAIKASLGYIASSFPAWTSQHTTISKKHKERKKQKQRKPQTFLFLKTTAGQVVRNPR